MVRKPVFSPFCALLAWAGLAAAADEPALPPPDVAAPAAEAYSCFIEPSEVVEVGSPVPGIVAEVRHDRAARVSAGDVVVRLERVIEESNLELAAARARFVDEIREQEVHLDFARRKYERARAMHAKKAITLEQLEQTEAAFRIAEKQLAKARHNHEIARLEHRRMQRLREQRENASPIDGVVVDRLIAPGEFVKDSPLLRIARLDPLKVEVILPAETWGTLGVQDTITVNARETGGRFAAEVAVIDRVIDSASGTYRVTLTLPNPDHAIASGLKCDVEHPSLGAPAAVAAR